MSLEDELSNLTPEGNTLLTVGVFDGVHLGHQKLLTTLVKQANEQQLTSGVVTFKNHPLGYVKGQRPPPELTSLSDKDKLIKSHGIDFVMYLSFSNRLAQTSARQFCLLLIRHLNMKGLVLGFDFAMGYNREGDIETIESLGHELGFGVELVAPVIISGEIVSSSAIRQAIASGDITKANNQLGRYFSIGGSVVKGRGIGKRLGFPTANINLDPEFVTPPNGVYATVACVDGVKFISATNIGTGPTFGSGKRQVEVHLIDFTGTLYGKQVKIEMVERIRDELKFNSELKLREQIIKDIDTIQAILKGKNGFHD